MVLKKHNALRTQYEGMTLPKAQNKRIDAFQKWRKQNRVVIEA